MLLYLASILLVPRISLANGDLLNNSSLEEESSPRRMPDFWLYGDMELTDDQKALLDVPTGADKTIFPPKAPAATRDRGLLWENGIIPYVFDCSLQNMPELKRIVRAAMDDWESKSCLRFVERQHEKEYFTLFRGTHCHSSVGKPKGEPSRLSVGDGCEYHHVMVHELGHVIGFWHEQSRPDRDDYVRIVWKNVFKGWEYAFLKQKWEAIDSVNTPYDYSSIMHYALNAFSRSPRRKTIQPLRKVRARPYRRISKIDEIQVNRMYNCPDQDDHDLEVRRVKRRVTSTVTGGLVTIRGFKRSNQAGKKAFSKCEDTSSACPFWAQKGFCDTRRDFMLTDCMRSCNVCKSDNEVEHEKLAEDCKDELKSCRVWAENGYCERRPDFMHVKCKKSCLLCDDDRCMDRDPRCRAWARWKYCTHKDYKQMMTQACRRSCAYCVVETRDCKDREKFRCPRLKDEGYCESEDPDWRLAIRNMCAKTCQFCRQIEVDTSKPKATPPCQDTFKACFGWSRLGYCLSRERYMKEYCARSCNLCASIDPEYTSEKCLDNDISCAEWKNMGFCELESKKKYMAFNCKRTCNLCRRKAALAPPPCLDKLKICPYWAQRGDCHIKALFMIKNCQQSCNICRSGLYELAVPPRGRSCKDLHQQCHRWAEEGFCDIYSNYMYKKCRLSCQACYPDETNDVAVVCKNKEDDANCEHWAGLGMCQNRADFMIDNCQYACNSCPTKPIKLLPEKPTGIKCRPGCKTWLERGYCSTKWRRRCLRTCLALGCDDEPVRPDGPCFEPLGVGWNFNLPDSAFNASSSLYGGRWDFGPHNARLYKEDDRLRKRVGAWCADDKNKESWLQVDLGKIKFVTAVATQGRDKFFEHVKSYELAFSKDGTRWHKYRERGRIRVLQGNCDHFTPVVNRLTRRIQARFVRFYPRTYNNICMRVEVYGCHRYKGYEKKKTPPPVHLLHHK